jgi:sugar phosphate isomerase/epimerase
MKRRNFIKKSGQTALGLGLFGSMNLLSGCENKVEESAQGQEQGEQSTDLFFKMSLAQWSFHRALGLNDEEKVTLDHLDFAKKAREMGFEGVEYVTHFFKDKAEDEKYLAEMKKRAADNDIQSLLIMVDGEGDLAIKDDAERTKGIENHYKWVEAAHFLGCHSIRVNVFGDGTAAEMTENAKDSLTRLSEYAAKESINVLVENHGGMSSDADWMANVMKEVNMKNCGMLPDFGNFCLEREGGERWGAACVKEYDKYKGVELFMPYAKAVSAKSYNFDESGEETVIDYKRMLKIVKDGGYTGFIGVEYEGDVHSEEDGIKLTKALLEKAGKEV